MSPRAGMGAALSEIARLLSSGFDVARVQEGILDAIGEMVGPSRIALLREDEAGKRFSIAAQRGLPPQLVGSLRLPSDGGLALWLAIEGRPVQAHELQSRASEATACEAGRELALLRAVVAIPLLAEGHLVAILALGQRVVGAPYRRDEIEALFDLGARAATAIRHLRRHHHLRDERACIDRVLSQLPSGVVCIDRRQRVVFLNRRAEEILALSRADVLDEDLRCLPSPLGDLLYDALRSGRADDRMEVQLVRPRLLLEVSVRPVATAEGPVAGAAIVFEDVSVERELAAQKRQHELFELLAALIRQMTDEGRRPLESLRTAVERAGHGEEPVEWSEEAVAGIRRDARRLVQTTEMLSALAGEGEFTFELLDLRKVIGEVFDELDARALPPARDGASRFCFTDDLSGKRAVADVHAEGDDLTAKCDRREIRRAITYLIWYLVEKGTGEEVVLSISVGPAPGAAGRRLHLLRASAATGHGPDELERMFDPLEVVRGRAIDVAPAVSRRIFEAHGGRLEASTRGGRVQFLAQLPHAGARGPAARPR